MRRLGKLGFGVMVVVIAVTAMAAAAVAAPPEFGRCVEVAPKTGEYRDGKHCLKPAPGVGKYNFSSGPGAKKKFTGTGGAITLESAKKVQVTCAGSALAGEYTGAKTLTANVTLSGCEEPATLRKCQTAAVKMGEIEGPGLEGELGYIATGAKPVVGIDFKHSPDLFTFECGQPREEITLVTVEGSVIATVKPVNVMTEEFKLLVKAKNGKQIPEQFEGASKDTLVENFTTGLTKTTESAVLNSKVPVLIKNEEPIEIRL